MIIQIDKDKAISNGLILRSPHKNTVEGSFPAELKQD